MQKHAFLLLFSLAHSAWELPTASWADSGREAIPTTCLGIWVWMWEMETGDLGGGRLGNWPTSPLSGCYAIVSMLSLLLTHTAN